MERFVITLYLHPVLDAALITTLKRTPRGKRGPLVREWLRSGPKSAEEADLDADCPNLEGLGIEL